MAIDRITTNGIKDGTITNTDVSTTAGIAGSKISAINFPFYKADGNYDAITVTNGELPFFKANGTQDNIGVA